MNPTDIVAKIRAANAARESYLPWSDYEEAADEIERLRGVLRWIDGQSNLFFAECSQAEEIVSRVRLALKGTRRPIDLLMALAYTDAWDTLPNDMQEEICVAVGWHLPPGGPKQEGASEALPEPRSGDTSIPSQEQGIREALERLVKAAALDEVENVVAGWNGPDPADPNPRHPSQLGAVIKTNCGRMYELAAALAQGRTALSSVGRGGGGK